MTSRHLLRFIVCIVGIAGAALPAPAADPLSKKTRKPDSKSIQDAPRKPPPVEAVSAKLDAVRAQPAARPAGAPRFQMMKAGERVVILDTETGKMQIIEPEPQSVLQKVDVGKAWVVVTVLGNASIRNRPAPIPPAPPLPEN